MADTVITPQAEQRDTSSAGWAVAVIVLLGVVLLGFLEWHSINTRMNATTPTQNTPGSIDVNVRLPDEVRPGVPGGTQQGTPGTNNPQTPTPAPAQ